MYNRQDLHDVCTVNFVNCVSAILSLSVYRHTTKFVRGQGLGII